MQDSASLEPVAQSAPLKPSVLKYSYTGKMAFPRPPLRFDPFSIIWVDDAGLEPATLSV